jgi:hypothetical protein
MERVVQRKDRGKKLNRLNRAVKCMIKFGKRRTWEKFLLDLQEGYKGNKKLLYAVMRNKTKPKTELWRILDRNRKFVWTRHLP